LHGHNPCRTKSKEKQTPTQQQVGLSFKGQKKAGRPCVGLTQYTTAEYRDFCAPVLENGPVTAAGAKK